MEPAEATQVGGQLRLPRFEAEPVRAIAARVGIGCGVLLLIALLVWLDRDGYSDLDDEVTFLDALYYATVSASTTGFGDIAPTTDASRLVNVLVITPLRLLFLVVLVGTTLEVLTRTSRDRFKIARWQRKVCDHTVIVGFGTKGRAAADRMLRYGTSASDIVVISNGPDDVAEATCRRIVGVGGDGTREEVLLAAALDRASNVIIAVATDATAVLVCLTARRLNPTARIVGAVRERENAPLLHDSGADSVMVSADSAGRQLATSLTSPAVGDLYGELLNPGQGAELVDRAVLPDEIGRHPADLPELVVGIVRDGELRTRFEGELVLEGTDRLVLVESSTT